MLRYAFDIDAAFAAAAAAPIRALRRCYYAADMLPLLHAVVYYTLANNIDAADAAAATGCHITIAAMLIFISIDDTLILLPMIFDASRRCCARALMIFMLPLMLLSMLPICHCRALQRAMLS